MERPRFSIRVSLTLIVYLTPFQRYKRFFSVENGAKTVLAARGRIRPELTSPVDSLTLIWFRSA
jgi:hypothetical protein